MTIYSSLNKIVFSPSKNHPELAIPSSTPETTTSTTRKRLNLTRIIALPEKKRMAYPGTLHTYTRRLVAFEHAPSTPRPAHSPATNTLLCIGGLSDGLLTNTYPSKIAAHLPPNWRVAEVLLTSSYGGWATGNLARDARELGECVQYFRSLPSSQPSPISGESVENGSKRDGKVVLMGCSTGCQDALEYVIGGERALRQAVDGIILQAGVSDREAWIELAPTMPHPSVPGETMAALLDAAIATATRLKDEGRGEDIMPKDVDVVRMVMGDPTTVYRTWSLLAEGGDDDFFSSDAGDDVVRRVFGGVGKGVRVAVIWGSEDEFVPKGVDKVGTIGRWGRAVAEGGAVFDDEVSGVVQGASHTLNKDPEPVVMELISRVVKFVQAVEAS
ncbi:unnamed protein product [Periconia digitata]|uniref:Uncharacterized protein n=1 Tax=Periconia digitata TaxID=1303443 RepID=A0A9W4XTZ7_9PLEO|nr:unnamed protein product [Periconia digitata]